MNETDSQDASMTLVEHLGELRTRLIYCAVAFLIGFFALFFFSDQMLQFFFEPVRSALEKYGLKQNLIFTSPLELLFAKIRVAMLGGFLVTMPIILYQIWAFVAPGLYKNEKGAVTPFMIASPFMFLIGGAFAQLFINDLAMDFLIGLANFDPEAVADSKALTIEYQGKVNENLGFSIQLIFAFGICFQLPVALALLGKVGLVSSEGLKGARKYAIVAMMFIAAIVTPPDPVTQIILFGVIYGLYEVSILLVKWLEPKFDDDELAL